MIIMGVTVWDRSARDAPTVLAHPRRRWGAAAIGIRRQPMAKRIYLSVLALCLLVPAALADRPATSGAFTVDLDDPPGNAIWPTTPTGDRGNILVNPGFEAGALAPWTTSAWVISTTGPHTGTYCAYDVGNNWIRQDFTPTPVAQIQAVTLWYRQPEISISAIDFFYGASDYDEFLVFLSTADWSFFDVTSSLRAVGSLQGMRIWGYSGGGSMPDETFIDDILIDVQGITPAQDGTWGEIKSLFR
jgi:hypothetical protein